MARPTHIGSRIRELRLARGLKQAAVAQAAGISSSYLNLIEHNRRGIGGKVLIDLAVALDVAPGLLSEGVDGDLLRAVQAASVPGVAVEMDRAEELVTRLPGWSALIARLSSRVEALEATVEGLSDRLSHDPFLSESLHAMVSSITAIQATSSILAQSVVEPVQQQRFQRNIHDESLRLSELSQALVTHFDNPVDEAQATSTPQDELEVFLSHHGYHFPMLEAEEAADVGELISGGHGLISAAGRMLAQDVLRQYQAEARQMPLDAFCEAAQTHDFDTQFLARQFQVPLTAVFRRLAFLPEAALGQVFGLISCDGAGAVMLRKAIPGFPLPRYAPACALWPLYQAMGRPHTAFRVALETPDEQVFLAEAYADTLGEVRFDQPPVIRSMMLVRMHLPHSTGKPGAEIGATPLAIGPNCRICPRDGCAGRREPSIHRLRD